MGLQALAQFLSPQSHFIVAFLKPDAKVINLYELFAREYPVSVLVQVRVLLMEIKGILLGLIR